MNVLLFTINSCDSKDQLNNNRKDRNNSLLRKTLNVFITSYLPHIKHHLFCCINKQPFISYKLLDITLPLSELFIVDKFFLMKLFWNRSIIVDKGTERYYMRVKNTFESSFVLIFLFYHYCLLWAAQPCPPEHRCNSNPDWGRCCNARPTRKVTSRAWFPDFLTFSELTTNATFGRMLNVQ